MFLGWPVLSSHFSPGFAPQVGQGVISIRLGDVSGLSMIALCLAKEAKNCSLLLSDSPKWGG